jgi:pyruvate dehydrogenase (quinone)
MATIGDVVIERLLQWGVRRIYGYPGDGINGVMGAVARRKDGLPEFVQVRHEEAAAFMACAHAKLTGEVGVCLATSGPGAVHLLNGLYDAKKDHQPVVAIVGQAARAVLGRAGHQEVDLPLLFRDVAREFAEMASVPQQVPHLLDRAFRIALSRRTVACLILPKDIQALDADDLDRAGRLPPTTFSPAHSIPAPADLARAAAVLNAGKRVAMLVGAGALGARAEVEQVAEVLGAGVSKALLGKAVLPDDLPYVAGCIGLLGTRPSWDLMRRCDTLLMVGSTVPYTEFLPEPGQARGVQIDLDPAALGLRYPMEVPLVGDGATTLRALLPLLHRKEDRSWQAEVAQGVARWWKLVDARAANAARPLNPQRVVSELSARLPDGSIVIADCGTSTTWFARHIRMRRGMDATISGGLATMGAGVPYAAAAKFCFPARPVVAIVGDGAMQMNGNAELLTIAKYAGRWNDPRLLVVVLNNRDLNFVTWEQRAFEGDPKFPASQDLPDFGYARYAESLGLLGIRVDQPEQVAGALERALTADRPAVIEAFVDPDVPPLPPHVTFQQASAYVSAMLRGDPDLGGTLRQTWRDLIEPLLPWKG